MRGQCPKQMATGVEVAIEREATSEGTTRAGTTKTLQAPDTPAYLVLSAWRKLDDALNEARAAHGLEFDTSNRSPLPLSLNAAELLMRAGLITASTYSAIENLLALRMTVAGYQFNPDEEAAKHYEMIASRITESLQELAAKGPRRNAFSRETTQGVAAPVSK